MKTLFYLIVVVSLALNVLLTYKVWFAATHSQSALSGGEMVVMRTAGGLLEVSTIASEERFDSTTDHTVLGVSIGRTIAQIRVPAVYRYHIPLAKDWTLRTMGKARW